ncbi:hypothetical protein CkaCkLH20_05594 [Colletotrichum karsti]|uniref:Uncharacterized protein n=1 Tax=Colletotrichum karsti TaxID=1095194 RepID=A0A9P6LKH0_9PEZI|nr:uncharacterized protein CkaCkLH20_05594 [Colletotrichum karsti]KAF9876748.1 hypothetical protein CkaCkLH20_05594 [Colletotrichum karsti]
MSPNSCSRPSLDPFDEASSHQSDQGEDANRRDDATRTTSTSSENTRNRPPPAQPDATSEDLHRLMMPDKPLSPRYEVAEQHPGPGPGPAASLSSSQNQKAAAQAEKTTTDAANTNPDAQVETESAAAADEKVPKLDPAGFFTLVSNSTTNTTHHPTVKYIFADDDPDVLTSALAAQHTANQQSSSSASASKTGKNPAPPPNNRTILLDVVPDADGQWKVSSAASLSADFAVTEASISRQEGETVGEGGLVLKIEGVDGEGAGGAGGGEKDKAESLPSSNSAVARSGGEEYGPILEEFERKMSVMKKVVKAGEARAEKARESKGAEGGGLESEGKFEGQE